MLSVSAFYQELLHDLEELGHIDGLADVGVHASVEGLALVLVKGIGRHSDDGDIRVLGKGQVADFAGCLVAIHHGHLDIHQD